MADVIQEVITAISGVFESIFTGLENVVNGFGNLSSDVAGEGEQ
ncbi:hypothetical protein [Corynebacterium halotolerans]